MGVGQRWRARPRHTITSRYIYRIHTTPSENKRTGEWVSNRVCSSPSASSFSPCFCFVLFSFWFGYMWVCVYVHACGVACQRQLTTLHETHCPPTNHNTTTPEYNIRTYTRTNPPGSYPADNGGGRPSAWAAARPSPRAARGRGP